MRALVLIILFLSGEALAQPPSNFGSAKTAAVKLWWDIGPSSFYCQCPYRRTTVEEKQIRSGNLWVVGSVCGYQAKNPVTSKGKPNARTTRIEWEHIVPADWIATGFDCQDQIRAQCRAITGYNEAEGDLFNLVPAIGELNGDRSARLYNIISGEERAYGACDFEVTTSGAGASHVRGAAEPMPSIRGDVARVWLYMIGKYGVTVPSANKVLMESWSADDPVDEAERIRHDKIAELMGWKNPFVAGQ
jgi:deoxyribonuclease-1